MDARTAGQLSERIKVLSCELESIYRRNDELRRHAELYPHRAQELAIDAHALFRRTSAIQAEHDAATTLLERLTAPTN